MIRNCIRTDHARPLRPVLNLPFLHSAKCILESRRPCGHRLVVRTWNYPASRIIAGVSPAYEIPFSSRWRPQGATGLFLGRFLAAAQDADEYAPAVRGGIWNQFLDNQRITQQPILSQLHFAWLRDSSTHANVALPKLKRVLGRFLHRSHTNLPSGMDPGSGSARNRLFVKRRRIHKRY